MNDVEIDETVEKIKEFSNKGIPCYVWGRITGPYSGCFYLNVIGIVKDDKCYVTAELNSYLSYKQYVAPSDYKSDYLTVGCVKIENIEDVLGRGYREIKVKPLTDIVEDVPYACVGQVIDMIDDLGYDRPEGFVCKCCDTPFEDKDDVMYLEGEFRGNGGIGIEVGAPVCQNCYLERHCSYCGEEIEIYQGDLDEDSHCIYCCKEKICIKCGEKIKIDWYNKEKDVENFIKGICSDCAE
ncbi:MAG: hypothetical protein AABY32_01575 [Nanoarchaeota archaeon]